MTQTTPPPPCPGCNGTGQMVYFGGVSRFQFSYTDCPECNGVGFLPPKQDDTLRPTDIYSSTSLSETEADAFFQALSESLCQVLKSGKTINLRGFGSFSIKAHSPSTTATVQFIPSPKLLGE